MASTSFSAAIPITGSKSRQSNESIIIQSGCHSSFVGQPDIEVESGKVVGSTHRLIAVDLTIAPDAAMETMIDTVVSPYRDMLSEVVGLTTIGLNRNTVLESTMDNLLLDAIAEVAGTKSGILKRLALRRPNPSRPDHPQRPVEYHPDQPADLHCGNHR